MLGEKERFYFKQFCCSTMQAWTSVWCFSPPLTLVVSVTTLHQHNVPSIPKMSGARSERKRGAK